MVADIPCITGTGVCGKITVGLEEVGADPEALWRVIGPVDVSTTAVSPR